MPEVRSIWRHWRQHPPVQWLVAGYLKYKPPQEQAQSSNFGDLARMFDKTPGLKLIQGGMSNG